MWEDIRLKERQGQGQGQKRSLEARADAFSRLKITNKLIFRQIGVFYKDQVHHYYISLSLGNND
jgi:hypothetical protein